jgi:hypothetical protein
MLGFGHDGSPSVLVAICCTWLASPVTAKARKSANVLGGKLGLWTAADDDGAAFVGIVEAVTGVVDGVAEFDAGEHRG